MSACFAHLILPACDYRSFFGHEAGRNAVEFIRDAQDGETILLALKFDSKTIAKEVINR